MVLTSAAGTAAIVLGMSVVAVAYLLVLVQRRRKAVVAGNDFSCVEINDSRDADSVVLLVEDPEVPEFSTSTQRCRQSEPEIAQRERPRKSKAIAGSIGFLEPQDTCILIKQHPSQPTISITPPPLSPMNEPRIYPIFEPRSNAARISGETELLPLVKTSSPLITNGHHQQQQPRLNFSLISQATQKRKSDKVSSIPATAQQQENQSSVGERDELLESLLECVRIANSKAAKGELVTIPGAPVSCPRGGFLMRRRVQMGQTRRRAAFHSARKESSPLKQEVFSNVS
ncbi:hypothetical protein BDR26DRAFT_850093 [Obelidium mucronatum]|nr:hypothetical protein BDR26DRAFT_850093 [Obelidium mucronatum]